MAPRRGVNVSAGNHRQVAADLQEVVDAGQVLRRARIDLMRQVRNQGDAAAAVDRVVDAEVRWARALALALDSATADQVSSALWQVALDGYELWLEGTYHV